ncbi:623_t:CDS:2, partial [Funneliformis caledonium]
KLELPEEEELGDELVSDSLSSSETFCLIFDHIVMIPMNNTGPISKKNAVNAKNGMLPEELSNDKLDMIRRSNFIKKSYW